MDLAPWETTARSVKDLILIEGVGSIPEGTPRACGEPQRWESVGGNETP